MKKLILPIVAALAVVAAVLVVVCYKPHSSPSATPQMASGFRANGGGQGAQAGPPQARGGQGQPAETGGATVSRQPTGTPAESQQRTTPQANSGNRTAPTPDSARQPQFGMGGPPQGEGTDTGDRPAFRPGRFMERMDTNGDGKISKAEWKAHYDEMFAQADKNKDGYIGSDEISAGFRPPGGMSPGGRRSGEGPGAGGPPAPGDSQ